MDPATEPSVPLSVLAQAEERERQIEAGVERGLTHVFRLDKTREYEHERGWWFGKVNPQG